MSDTKYPVLAATTNHELRTVEFTRVTELLDNPWNFQAVAEAFIDEVNEYEPDDAVIVVSVDSITPEEEKREEIDYRLTVLITPEDRKMIADQTDGALFDLDEPDCETCGGSGYVQQFRRFDGEAVAGEPVDVPCPDCSGEEG
jgi:hypothetical protein